MMTMKVMMMIVRSKEAGYGIFFFRKIGFFRICLGQTLYINPRFSIQAMQSHANTIFTVFFSFFLCFKQDFLKAKYFLSVFCTVYISLYKIYTYMFRHFDFRSFHKIIKHISVVISG